MDNAWPYLAGFAFVALVPVGTNDFAKQLWGMEDSARPPVTATGMGPQGQYTHEQLAARQEAIRSITQGGSVGIEGRSDPALASQHAAARAVLAHPGATQNEIVWASRVLSGSAQVGPAYQAASGLHHAPNPALPQARSPARLPATSMDYPASPASSGMQGYRGMSGATYQYDLSKPIQQLRYETDPMAQLRDSTSIDPRRDLDRSIGQYGGGIDR